MQVLEKYQLTAPYVNLLQTIRSGNMSGYLQHLETYFDYFYSNLTYLLLKERGIVLVWRCLIKNMYVGIINIWTCINMIDRYNQKQNLGATIPVIEFRDCLKAFQFAAPQDQSYTLEDMECVLVSLVSQVKKNI